MRWRGGWRKRLTERWTVNLCNPKVWVTTVNVSAFQEDKRTNKESGNHSYYTWAELLYYCKEETKKEVKTGFRTHSRTVTQTAARVFPKAGNAFMTSVGFNNDNNDWFSSIEMTMVDYGVESLYQHQHRWFETSGRFNLYWDFKEKTHLWFPQWEDVVTLVWLGVFMWDGVNVTMMSHQFLCPRMSVLKSDLMCMKIIWTIMCKDCPFEWCLSLYTIKKQWRHLTTTTEFTFNLYL